MKLAVALGIAAFCAFGVFMTLRAKPPAPRLAASSEVVPAELRDIQIEDKFGTVLPRDLLFVNHEGKTVTLGSVLGGSQPTILVLAYYRCPMLCTVVFNGLLDGMKDLKLDAGRTYRVVSVSIDPRDTVERAAHKRTAYLASYNRPGADWTFLTDPTGKSSEELAKAVGFHYRYDKAGDQYAHAAGAFVIGPDGRVARTLYGISFPADTLKLALVEAGDGKVGSAWDKIRLFCFHYDPNARGYVASAWVIMRLGGVAVVAALGILLLVLWRRPTGVAT
jgi:protein SCO1/2